MCVPIYVISNYSKIKSCMSFQEKHRLLVIIFWIFQTPKWSRILKISFTNFILSNDFHTIKHLGEKYGQGMVKEVRNLEKFITKLIKSKCDEEFSRICLIYHLIPNFVRFKLWTTRYTKYDIYK